MSKQYAENRHNNPPPSTPTFQKDWILNQIKNETTTWAHDFAKAIQEVSTSQLRKFFGALKSVQINLLAKEKGADISAFRTKVILLKPTLAYAAARAKVNDKGGAFVEFERQMTSAIDEVCKAKDDAQFLERFNRFVSLVEAVVAYHKQYSKN